MNHLRNCCQRVHIHSHQSNQVFASYKVKDVPLPLVYLPEFRGKVFLLPCQIVVIHSNQALGDLIFKIFFNNRLVIISLKYTNVGFDLSEFAFKS